MSIPRDAHLVSMNPPFVADGHDLERHVDNFLRIGTLPMCSSLLDTTITSDAQQSHMGLPMSRMHQSHMHQGPIHQGQIHQANIAQVAQQVAQQVVLEEVRNLENQTKQQDKKKSGKKGRKNKQPKADKPVKPPKKATQVINMEKHPIKPPCYATCSKRCTHYFGHESRESIWRTFWSMRYNERKQWLFHHVNKTPKKTGIQNSRRGSTNVYTLVDSEGFSQTVCKTFFLGTLAISDTMITTLFKTMSPGARTPAKDKRGGSHKAHRYR